MNKTRKNQSRFGEYLPPAPSTSAVPAPVLERERLRTLDVLRGFALLGILMVNIQAFAMPGAAYLNPSAYGDLAGWNRVVWAVTHVLFDQKFISIFAMLFGAGMLLFADHAGANAKRVHYRRMALLLVFGLLHAHFIWYGDILVSYALCGMILFPLRNRRPRTLITTAVTLLAIGSGIMLAGGASMSSWPASQVQAFTEQSWLPPATAIEQEIATYRGGWLQQLPLRSTTALMFETMLFAIVFFWKAGGLMLMGMGLYKLGVLAGKADRYVYGMLIGTALFIGIPVVAYGAYRNVAADWDVRYSFFFGSQFNHWGSVLVALGWMSAIVLLVKSGSVKWLVARFEALGRTAFTNYVLQSVVCTLIFYGHGLGQFGRIERTGQVMIVGAIWIAQLLLAPLLVKHLYHGPLEWAWRSLTYGRKQPFRRVARST